MSQPSILDNFAGHAFLKSLSESHRLRLASNVRPFAKAAGQYLARADEPAHAFYLIHSGRVGIGTHLGERGHVPIQTVGPGEVVGWSWLLPPFRWQFDAQAMEPVQGLAFDAEWLREQCEHDHELGYHLLKQLVAVISSRLAAAQVQQLDIYR